ncbi:MAG TPA: hypothetical protein VGA95_07275 [Thermodesulfobacteriota bacterium]
MGQLPVFLCSMYAATRIKTRFTAILICASLFLSSCGSLSLAATETLEEAKSGLVCVEYKDNLTWQKVEELLGEPDEFPLPQPDQDLSKNARVYKSKNVIFYTERREIQEGEKVRFQEVITKIEVCGKK